MNENKFVVLGTDTDVGKSTVSLLFLHGFAPVYSYWKPVETGDSDSARVAQLIPGVLVHPPVMSLRDPVAPPLAARREGRAIPIARELAQRMPTKNAILVETFGSPFSPLNESELQLELIRELASPSVLVASTALGAIGRTMQCIRALESEGLAPLAVVLLGMPDLYAEEQIRHHARGIAVISLVPPVEWSVAGLRDSANRQAVQLEQLRRIVSGATRSSSPASLLAEDRRTVWHPYTPLVGADDPLPVVGATAEFLELADGSRVVDGISSWWTILHGHRHPPLMRALADAANRLDHVLFAGATHAAAVELADLLLGTMPWCGGRVFYSDNGSTAVEVALKMAYQYWRHRGEKDRTRFIGFEHGYHGDTFGAMAVSRDPLFFGPFEPLLFRADILPIDPARLDDHLREHAHETAAVILEPIVQGAGGMRMHSPETLKQVVEIAHRHDVLFIADEVMTGGGRTGSLWAHQLAGVVPDLVCAAKTLTGGMLPLAATLASPRIVAAFQDPERSRTFFHGHSFTANPLACAVAACNMRSLIKSPCDPSQRMEAFWRTSLTPLRSHPRVQEVRIRGGIAAIELRGENAGYLADIGPRMRRSCLRHGVLLRPLGNVLYAMPPFCTSQDSLERIARAMIAAVDA